MWVSVPIYHSLQQVRTELLTHLEAEGFDFEIQPDTRESRPDMVIDEHYDTIFTTVKVAIVKGISGGNGSYRKLHKPIHLLV